MNTMIKVRLGRIVLLLLGMSSLVAGVWGGLVRLPLNLPLPGGNAYWITYHGPLMVCGFLGTVIALERAVGLGRWWMYLPPLLAGSGAVLALTGHVQGGWPAKLITVGSALFWVVTLRVVKLQPVLFTGGDVGRRVRLVRRERRSGGWTGRFTASLPGGLPSWC